MDRAIARPEVDFSVIVPVGERHSDAASLHAEYKAGLDAIGQSYELIYVLDGPRREFEAGLRSLLEQGERFTVVSLTRNFGEATALMAGFEHSSGQVILTLPAYHQIEGSEIRQADRRHSLSATSRSVDAGRAQAAPSSACGARCSTSCSAG